MPIDEPFPDLDELLDSMGEAGARISDVGASEGGAGNISICLGWEVELQRRFPNHEEIELPLAAPALSGRTLLVTGSGRRLRQIRADALGAVGALRIHDGGTTATLHTSPRRLFDRLTSELNSHLAVHQDQVERRAIAFQAVVHAPAGAAIRRATVDLLVDHGFAFATLSWRRPRSIRTCSGDWRSRPSRPPPVAMANRRGGPTGCRPPTTPRTECEPSSKACARCTADRRARR